ncbi:hypothetical protein HFD91_02220 [Enterobacteriaceae bacterium EKM102V]|uniref:hypothetical protein n=1 Tax=Pantoea TaxID=53335 RepID=UPI00142D423C|nr:MULTISPECIES: hypothetical protein [Pantoea]KAF6662403.1 hypothetical protein HFD91_02220 [Enterobacteriaceae bacterium EKM102V]KAF6670869.1 hypothetical protein HFD97_02225 [Pantoea sp. EKM103V]
MRNEYMNVLKEVSEKIELMEIVGGEGSGQWETGAVGIWAGIMGGLGYSCSWPGNFYGGDSSSYSGMGYGGASGPGGYGANTGANNGS